MTHKRIFIIIGVLIAIVALGGAVWHYFFSEYAVLKRKNAQIVEALNEAAASKDADKILDYFDGVLAEQGRVALEIKFNSVGLYQAQPVRRVYTKAQFLDMLERQLGAYKDYSLQAEMHGVRQNTSDSRLMTLFTGSRETAVTAANLPSGRAFSVQYMSASSCNSLGRFVTIKEEQVYQLFQINCIMQVQPVPLEDITAEVLRKDTQPRVSNTLQAPPPLKPAEATPATP